MKYITGEPVHFYDNSMADQKHQMKMFGWIELSRVDTRQGFVIIYVKAK